MPTVIDRLHDLLDAFSDAETLAVELSKIAGKSPPWTATYIIQVTKYNVKASKRLNKAVRKLHSQQPGVHRPTSGTWVPFRNKDEQERVLNALTGEERRLALLSAAYAKGKGSDENS